MPELIVESVPLSSLKPDKANARTHSPRNVEAIKASLAEFGQREPLVVHKSTVIAGNGRLEAMLELGWTEVAVHRVPDDWTVKQARAYAIASNRTAELAAWDTEALLKTLGSLPNDLQFAAGFDPGELSDLDAAWGTPPSLDDLAGDFIDPGDESIRISFRVSADVAAMWTTVLKATGISDSDAAAEAMIRAAYEGVQDQ